MEVAPPVGRRPSLGTKVSYDGATMGRYLIRRSLFMILVLVVVVPRHVPDLLQASRRRPRAPVRRAGAHARGASPGPGEPRARPAGLTQYVRFAKG